MLAFAKTYKRVIIDRDRKNWHIGFLTFPIEKKIENQVGQFFSSPIFEIVSYHEVIDQFEAIWKPNSGFMISKSYIFSNSNLLSYKNWHSSAFILLFWVKVFLYQKMLTFYKKC